MKYLNDSHIRLRALEPEDVDVLFDIENDTDEWESSASCTPCSRYALNNYIRNSAHDFLIDNQIRLIIERIEDNAVLGLIELFDYNPLVHKAELGIIVLKEYRGLGYASAAIDLIKKYVCTFFHLSQIYVYVRTDNFTAIELFRKNGFIVSGTLQKWLLVNGDLKDVHILQWLDSSEKNVDR